MSKKNPNSIKNLKYKKDPGSKFHALAFGISTLEFQVLFFSPAEFIDIHPEVQAALVQHLLYFRQ